MADLTPLQRHTRRISVSLPQRVYERLLHMADQQGRSASNLTAFLIEARLRDIDPHDPLL